MKFRAELLEIIKGKHCKAQRDEVIRLILEDPSRIKALMDIFFKEDLRTCQKASWPLSFIAERESIIMKPYVHKIIKNLDKQNHHSAVLRNSLRLLALVDIPSAQQMPLLDKCIQYIMNNNRAVAVRAFAITVADNLTKDYPELRDELKEIVREQLEYPQTAAIKFRAKRLLKSG